VVIDDTVANLRLLTDILTDAGYLVRAVSDPHLAVEAVTLCPPDLVLLDIDMPELDGFAVCRQLKESPNTASVPVIFVSAFAETEYKLEAFLAGGVDYITKPFRAAEVKARVRAHVELAQARRQLQESYARLSELEALRESFTHMLVHDLRTPLNAMSLTLELLTLDDRLDSALRPDVAAAQRCGVTLSHMLSSVLDIARMEDGKMPTSLTDATPSEILNKAYRHLGLLGHDQRLTFEALADLPVRCDIELASRILVNLIVNALSFVDGSDGQVTVGTSVGRESIRIWVSDNGPGIEEEGREALFRKFGQVDSGVRRKIGHTSGLGLAFCKMAIDAQEGRIGVESEVGQGSTFWFELLRSERLASLSPQTSTG
jgi:signal transduction histidine kinase